MSSVGRRPESARPAVGRARFEDDVAGMRPGSAGLRPGSAGLRPGSAGLRPGSAGLRPGSATGHHQGGVGEPSRRTAELHSSIPRPTSAGLRVGQWRSRPGSAASQPTPAGAGAGVGAPRPGLASSGREPVRATSAPGEVAERGGERRGREVLREVQRGMGPVGGHYDTHYAKVGERMAAASARASIRSDVSYMEEVEAVERSVAAAMREGEEDGKEGDVKTAEGHHNRSAESGTGTEPETSRKGDAATSHPAMGRKVVEQEQVAREAAERRMRPHSAMAVLRRPASAAEAQQRLGQIGEYATDSKSARIAWERELSAYRGKPISTSRHSANSERPGSALEARHSARFDFTGVAQRSELRVNEVKRRAASATHMRKEMEYRNAQDRLMGRPSSVRIPSPEGRRGRSRSPPKPFRSSASAGATSPSKRRGHSARPSSKGEMRAPFSFGGVERKVPKSAYELRVLDEVRKLFGRLANSSEALWRVDNEPAELAADFAAKEFAALTAEERAIKARDERLPNSEGAQERAKAFLQKVHMRVATEAKADIAEAVERLYRMCVDAGLGPLVRRDLAIRIQLFDVKLRDNLFQHVQNPSIQRMFRTLLITSAASHWKDSADLARSQTWRRGSSARPASAAASARGVNRAESARPLSHYDGLGKLPVEARVLLLEEFEDRLAQDLLLDEVDVGEGVWQDEEDETELNPDQFAISEGPQNGGTVHHRGHGIIDDADGSLQQRARERAAVARANLVQRVAVDNEADSLDQEAKAAEKKRVSKEFQDALGEFRKAAIENDEAGLGAVDAMERLLIGWTQRATEVSLHHHLHGSVAEGVPVHALVAMEPDADEDPAGPGGCPRRREPAGGVTTTFLGDHTDVLSIPEEAMADLSIPGEIFTVTEANMLLPARKMGSLLAKSLRCLGLLARAKRPQLRLAGLVLKGLSIGDQGAMHVVHAFAGAVPNACLVQVLNLSECSLTGAFPQHLGRIFNSNIAGQMVLRTLDLRGNSLGDKGLASLAELLPEQVMLQRLEVGRNGVTAAGLMSLAVSYEGTHGGCDLRKIGLEWNAIAGRSGGKALAALARALPLLDTVKAGCNQIGSDGADEISRDLAAHLELDNGQYAGRLGLRTLDLSDNGIAVEGARALAGLVGMARCPVQLINLARNPLGGDGMRALAEAVAKRERDAASKTILSLSLEGCLNEDDCSTLITGQTEKPEQTVAELFRPSSAGVWPKKKPAADTKGQKGQRPASARPASPKKSSSPRKQTSGAKAVPPSSVFVPLLASSKALPAEPRVPVALDLSLPKSRTQALELLQRAPGSTMEWAVDGRRFSVEHLAGELPPEGKLECTKLDAALGSVPDQSIDAHPDSFFEHNVVPLLKATSTSSKPAQALGALAPSTIFSATQVLRICEGLVYSIAEDEGRLLSDVLLPRMHPVPSMALLQLARRLTPGGFNFVMRRMGFSDGFQLGNPTGRYTLRPMDRQADRIILGTLASIASCEAEELRGPTLAFGLDRPPGAIFRNVSVDGELLSSPDAVSWARNCILGEGISAGSVLQLDFTSHRRAERVAGEDRHFVDDREVQVILACCGALALAPHQEAARHLPALAKLREEQAVKDEEARLKAEKKARIAERRARRAAKLAAKRGSAEDKPVEKKKAGAAVQKSAKVLRREEARRQKEEKEKSWAILLQRGLPFAPSNEMLASITDTVATRHLELDLHGEAASNVEGTVAAFMRGDLFEEMQLRMEFAARDEPAVPDGERVLRMSVADAMHGLSALRTQGKLDGIARRRMLEGMSLRRMPSTVQAEPPAPVAGPVTTPRRGKKKRGKKKAIIKEPKYVRELTRELWMQVDSRMEAFHAVGTFLREFFGSVVLRETQVAALLAWLRVLQDSCCIPGDPGVPTLPLLAASWAQGKTLADLPPALRHDVSHFLSLPEGQRAVPLILNREEIKGLVHRCGPRTVLDVWSGTGDSVLEDLDIVGDMEARRTAQQALRFSQALGLSRAKVLHLLQVDGDSVEFAQANSAGLWSRVQNLVSEARKSGRPGLLTLGMRVSMTDSVNGAATKISSSMRARRHSSLRLKRLLTRHCLASRICLHVLRRHARAADEAHLCSVAYDKYDGKQLERFVARAELEDAHVERLRPLLQRIVRAYLSLAFRYHNMVRKFLWRDSDTRLGGLWTLLLTLFARPNHRRVLELLQRRKALEMHAAELERDRGILSAPKRDKDMYRDLLQLAEDAESDDGDDVEYV